MKKRYNDNLMKKNLASLNITLLLLIIFAFGIRIYNLNYNSLFFDEATYIRLGKEFFYGTIDSTGAYSWVGGMPIVYPPISAIGYMLGGVIGARLINVLLGTITVYLVYIFIKQLQFFKNNSENSLSGVFGALLFSVFPLTIHLSRIAIYDMLSFTLFISGIVFLQKFIYGEKYNSNYIWSLFSFFVSFLAKYSVLMFFPFIFLIITVYVWRVNKKRIEEVILFILILSSIIGFYLYSHSTDFMHFVTSQVVNRDTTTILSKFDLFKNITVFMYIPGVIGLLYFINLKKIQTVLLLFLSVVPLFIHLISQNTATLQQNAIFSLLFIAPLAAGAFVCLTNKYKYLGYSLVFIYIFAIYIQTAPQRYDFEHFWPNSTSAMNFLQNRVTKGDKVLAEADDVAAVALERKMPMTDVIGPYDFSYKKQNGTSAYIRAVQDAYFTYIELEKNGNTFENSILPEIIKNYTLIYKESYFEIYKLK
jgi:4-amino-4-deoxy-L-arabinose transferase-like glycosyltransferase